MFENKLVVVTGGLSGLGAATVKHFKGLNAHVAIIDLHLPKDEQDTDQIKFIKADVSESSQVQDATSAIVGWCKDAGLSIVAVVCCAGYLGSAKIISKKGATLDMERFKKVIDVSLTGTVDIIRCLLPQMVSQQPDSEGSRGVIITVSSAAAFDGQEGQVAYGAAKGGIASMTLPLARDLSQWGIRGVCIAPGMFETNMVSGMPSKVQESLQKTLEFPKRGGRPEEFAGLVEHVIRNKMLNGTVVRLDGAARMPSRL